jgi:hypothetical protein
MKSIISILIITFIALFAANHVSAQAMSETATPNVEKSNFLIVQSAPSVQHLNEGEYVFRKQGQHNEESVILAGRFPRHHSKSCHHAKHRTLCVTDRITADFLTQQQLISTPATSALSIASPANTQHMNEAEYIFYRKLQRLKLA